MDYKQYDSQNYNQMNTVQDGYNDYDYNFTNGNYDYNNYNDGYNNAPNLKEKKPSKKKKGAGKIILIILLLLAILSVVGTVLFFTAFKGVRAERHISLGQKYLHDMNYEEAVAEFEKAAKIDPMNAEAYLGMAEAYLGMGDYEHAAIALYKGVNATNNKKVRAAYEDLLEKYAAEICEVTMDEVIPHDFEEASPGMGPVCRRCGYEDKSAIANYFDKNDIPYLDTMPESFEANYLTYDMHDFSNYSLSTSPMEVSVSVEPYGEGYKRYTIVTKQDLYRGPGQLMHISCLGIGDFYSGVQFKEEDTDGNSVYSGTMTIPYLGEEIEIDVRMDDIWILIDNGMNCQKRYRITTPSDYDGLVLVNRENKRWITEAEAEMAAAQTDDEEVTYVDSPGRFDQLVPASEGGVFIRVKGEFDKEYEKLLLEN